MSFSVIQALLAFLLVLVAIPAALAVVRRSRHLGAGRASVIRLTGGLALGPRERIAVVEVGGRWLVVGVTGQSINLLATFDEPPGALPGTAEAPAGPTSAPIGPASGPATSADGRASAPARADGSGLMPVARAFARVLAQARERQGR
jgi:flagellar biosynthetic protein FliO